MRYDEIDDVEELRAIIRYLCNNLSYLKTTITTLVNMTELGKGE